VNPIELIEKYYSKDSIAYANLVTHSKMVTQKALAVVDKHPELYADRQFVENAAMLHDIGIIFTKAPKIGCDGKWPYICHGHLGAELLRKEGYPFLARVSERHTGTGLTREDIVNQNIPIPPANYVPETIEEIIVCYADKFFSKGNLTKALSFDDILKKVAKYGKDKKATLLKWHEIFR
jgi:uncharacterized protein